MIFRLKSGHQVKTSLNTFEGSVLLTNSNQEDYCRVILSPTEARKIAEQLVNLADELEETLDCPQTNRQSNLEAKEKRLRMWS
jgi:hypothetical protein